MAKGQRHKRQLVSAAVAAALMLMRHASANAQEPAPAAPQPPPPPETTPVAPVAPTEPLPPMSTEAPKSPPTDLGNNPDRSVGRHQFIYPQFVDSSFVATYFGLRTRVARFTAANLPIERGPIDIEAGSFAQGFDLGIKIVDWIGLTASAGVNTLISTNLPSLVHQGATYSFWGNLGPIVRLLRSERTGTQLSLRGQVGGSSGQVSSLAPLFTANTVGVAFRDVVEGNFSESIKTPVRTVTFGGSLALAQAISPVFGIQAVAGMGWNSTTVDRWDPNTATRPSTTFDGVTYRLGIAASADFNSLHVPVAIMLEYLTSRQTSTSQVASGDELDTIHDIFGGIYYSGRPNLQLGMGGGTEVNLGPSTSPQGRSERPRYILGQFIIRYVW